MPKDEELPPVVFIHGWKASILADHRTGEEKFNLSLSQCLGLGQDPDLTIPLQWDESGNQVKDELIATEPVSKVTCLCNRVTIANVYGPLIERLKATRTFEMFTYDWRRCLDEASSLFETFLETAIKNDFGGQAPQVIGHSMGCLVTLSTLNRRPELFHSVLFGAAAFSPNLSVMKDLSLTKRMNVIVKNSTLFTPMGHISNPSPFFFLSRLNEREAYGKEHLDLLVDTDEKPVPIDLHKIETFQELKMGMYHPESGIDKSQQQKLEKWVQSILDKALAFRKSLIPPLPPSVSKAIEYPPVSVLRGDHCPTEFSYVQRAEDGMVDFENNVTSLRGDGRIVLEDALPPKGIPVCKVVTNNEEHSLVLNDLESVEELLNFMIAERKKMA
mmetsp:Transcript_26151/g.31650  ORF Transcript_26151/g.31650 Transcript_26151/m.31650 type:complete len:387 (-) Transcript_26151:239-1399(-)|eukprot:CAMPEP_0172489174 /NCGR_PEP_ID=MMETSP1066-20121228/19009_1 /TAXON_ID=671091 /ORGANISM="Coscinodiscus wailesii, Strain CCMP2513" /LENGTH=386 /DNA_ID=CAMNT_0013256839 /DNA_START=176 /DNA_END=1336 /DNA_ORIENTATION=+